MNAKEYLQQGFYLDKKIESNLREVAELRHLCLGISAAGLEESHNPNRPTEAPFVRTIEKIWEREQEINREVDRLVDLKKEIGETIRRVEDPRQRTVLEYRYLCYMRFTKIAEVLNYGESTIRVWHQKGLERLESFLNPDENLAENSGK